MAVPFQRCQSPNRSASSRQQIEGDYEPEAVKKLSELAEAFADDYPTQKLIYKWIDGETAHMAWEAQYLNYIEKLGYENFLISMM